MTPTHLIRPHTLQLRTRWAAAALWVALGALSCADDGGPETETTRLERYGPQACVSGPEELTVQVTREAVLTGPVNNALRLGDRYGWVVQSGENTLGRLDLESGDYVRAFADLGNERNPWDVALGDGRLYVTHYATGTVSVVDAERGDVLAETAQLGVALSGVAAGEGLVVVADSGFDGAEYGPSGVVVLRRLDQAPHLEEIGRLEGTARNAAEVVYDARRRAFFVVYTGARAYDAQTQTFTVSSDGAIERLSAAALLEGRVAEAREGVAALARDPDDPRAGAPQALVVGEGSVGYAPSASAPHIYSVDLDAMTPLRDPSNPIVAYDGDGDQLTAMALRPDGLAYVIAFNQDAAYLLDTACDAPIAGPLDLGRAPLLEGPLRVAYDAKRDRAWVLMSLSNAITRIDGP